MPPHARVILNAQLLLLFLTALSLVTAMFVIGTPSGQSPFFIQIVDYTFFRLYREYQIPPIGPSLGLVIGVVAIKLPIPDRFFRAVTRVNLVLHGVVVGLMSIGLLAALLIRVN